MKETVIINGSCRKNGNTDRLLSSLEEGATSAGVKTIQYVLREKTINQCRGCYYCYKNKKCAIDDDMQSIHDALQRADLFILASPMYWWGFTGLMKTFIDRLYLYYFKDNTPLIAGKKIFIIVPMNVNEEQHGLAVYQSEIEPLMMTSRYIFKRLGLQILDIVFFPGLSTRASLKSHPEHLAGAYGLGESLGQYSEGV